MIRKFLTTAHKFNAAKSINQKIKYSFLNNQPPEFDVQKDYYRILELSKNASDSDVKKSYYKLAKQYHPDANKGYEAKFKDISEAYGVLSNDKIKQQYDSARTFKEGWSKMGSKAQQGSYSYEEYQNVFYNMSPEQREQFQRQSQARLRRFGMIMGGFFLFLLFFSRTPHKAYTQYNGTLIPFENTSQFQYPDNYGAQPSVYNPNASQNAQYVQPNNPYAGQPPFPAQQSQAYGSQYPQGQYLNQYSQQQQYQQPVSGSSYPASQQQYYSPPQQKSPYTIDRAQPHQPYPNSGYAQKPIQSNLRSDYRSSAPAGLDQ